MAYVAAQAQRQIAGPLLHQINGGHQDERGTLAGEDASQRDITFPRAGGQHHHASAIGGQPGLDGSLLIMAQHARSRFAERQRFIAAGLIVIGHLAMVQAAQDLGVVQGFGAVQADARIVDA